MADIIRKLRPFLAPLIIIVIAGGLSYYWLSNKPRANRKPEQAVAPLVEIIKPKIINHPTTIPALGNVIASQSVNLNSRVSGMVIAVSDNFIEGGLLKKDEKIVQIDPTDFQLAVRQKKSDLARAEFNLKLEMGQQTIAQREFEMLGKGLGEQARELVLRKPHLSSTRAALDAAKAALEQAKLDLSRTTLYAPFNGIVTARNANIGSWISTFSTGTPVVKLVATDTYWIDVSLPVDKIRWLAIPGINAKQGAPVKIFYEQAWGPGVYRTGVVKRLKAEVETQGRMAKLIVEVKDPLSQETANKHAPPLMLGTLVRAEIGGKILNDVIALPAGVLHDGNTLRLLTENNTLDIVTVTPLWSEHRQVFIGADQLPDNARIINSDLATPVEGMSLRLQEQKLAIVTDR
ncbi:MAG: efflux RND transporter periplasmic adaptor subunit [Gammaproteobacteria bacterium HGW-Gammaproteobacteria-3]|nr:MAG: efflux RND transporter periplasmic adaptor subunit [Gammaproteobacteria bacterium HGW-Gammaproteobacteria-3]